MPRASRVKSSSRNLTIGSVITRASNINIVWILVLLLIIASFLIGVLVTKISYLEKGSVQGANVNVTQNQGAATYTLGSKVDLGKNDVPVLGKKTAKVAVVEFADFQCPYCEKWFKGIESNLIKDYVNTGKATFTFRHFAFLDQASDPAGPESTQAANASECANEQGKFWDYHDYLYSHQGQEDSGTFSIDNLKQFAANLGLNTDQFNSCLDNKKYAKVVQDDIAAGQKAGVNATPFTFINGKMVQYGGDSAGALPYSEFKKLLDKEIAASK